MSGLVQMEAPKALRSFYGASDRLKRNNTAKAATGTGERPQDICTPVVIRDAILKVWDHVELDPCWSPKSIIPCRRYCCVPPRIEITGSGKERVVFRAGPGESDGLLVNWPDYTFVNMPFKYLQRWLSKTLDEAEGGKEIMVLCPNRTNRRWFRAAKRAAASVCELDPVQFLGYDQTFPQPMVVLYYGERVALFEQAFAHLGDC